MGVWNREYVDVVVLGSGLAGLSAAVAAAEEGLDVLVVTKEDNPLESNTYLAQGGIVYRGEKDSPDLLMRDILEAGAYYNLKEAVRLVAEEGPGMVEEYLIKRAGVPFDTTTDGFDFTKEGAHSLRRILHVKDETGKSIQEHFLAYVGSNPHVKFLSGYTAIDLVTNSHNSLDPEERYRRSRVVGVYLLNPEGGVDLVFTGAVVLATGGIGNLFLHTSNPPGATGDGVAMASRAGVPVINAHFIQFHPTVLYHRDFKRMLITEAFRGEGARLMNHSGEYFMERIHPLKDLAPRDEVARAIYREMEREGTEYVFLDARTLSVDVRTRFPYIYQSCLQLGLDISKDPIPVVPAAHYFCGGVKVNLDGRTELSGLYAVGECACTGVHGANRLASVSLLEALTFGIRAGKDIARRHSRPTRRLQRSIPDWVFPPQEEDVDPVLVKSDLKYLRSLMWHYVGIIRTSKRLNRALADINYLQHRVESFYKKAKVRRDIVELRNAVLVARIITQSAVSQQVSVGCHYVEH
ncbi:L-aspartate oxidase [Spirochaeta thermophila]|uniref:L-aspartate oxidase n=1 Tax=Winmispira thermophila (strain ATCC 49972 / DSM 6192 / RI 19.B1) TaxID=665571 RepID=E0RSJ5_WINT6|nr:L-aspartate oxidase [Spirochaeta thermophila]ADN01982.1 L-aspartate oxidase [Spirochaeta thermophila DSM 6192]